jgi:hypothetical protein
MKIDLHGVKHEEVQGILDDFIFNEKPPFEIITGNSMEMKNIVFSVLKEYKLNYFKINEGSLVVLG